MAIRTYTGRLTDFSRAAFPASEVVEFYLEPLHPGFGPTGLLAKRRVPITVASDGSFTISIESSASVRPYAKYKIIAVYLAAGRAVGESEWHFTAPNESGDLGQLGASSIGIDTDGVPFYDPGNWDNSLRLDTDGVPYFLIGA